jgi:hypothetical protein
MGPGESFKKITISPPMGSNPASSGKKHVFAHKSLTNGASPKSEYIPERASQGASFCNWEQEMKVAKKWIFCHFFGKKVGFWPVKRI